MENQIIDALRKIDLKLPVELDKDIDLKQFGLDSLNIITLALELEERYNIQFPDNVININNFSSIREIERVIVNIIEFK
ncbi:phosphopantetheine-binding protein [Paenibacillus popilliae]|uniref:Acyl carrier protein n=1 Tax=Paenibacillus popilliae TaxID=78057 RepID=A0ABY3AJ32_PAEPP|nr:phosphopantetheine-binding protein [Paenibacillus sp. SDF0028]TQR41753.1 acyl carrier protein [Paenibacillus sp. SDF0028]